MCIILQMLKAFKNGCCCSCGFLLWKQAYKIGSGPVWPHPYRMPTHLTCCCIWSSETPPGLTTWPETLFLLNWHTGHQGHTCGGKHQHSPSASRWCKAGSPLSPIVASMALAAAGCPAMQSPLSVLGFWIFFFFCFLSMCELSYRLLTICRHLKMISNFENSKIWGWRVW